MFELVDAARQSENAMIREPDNPEVAEADQSAVTESANPPPLLPEDGAPVAGTTVRPARISDLARPISLLLAAAEAGARRIIGISSDRHGSGVSLIAHELAKAYVELGRRTLLVDASSLVMDKSSIALKGGAPIELGHFARSDTNGFMTVALTTLPARDRLSTEQLRSSFKAWAAQPGIVIVDLPPACDASGVADPTAIVAGGACDGLFLILLTGVVSAPEFNNCLMKCRAGGVTLDGLVLNDWKMTGSRLLSQT